MKSPLTGMRVKEGIRAYFQSVGCNYQSYKGTKDGSNSKIREAPGTLRTTQDLETTQLNVFHEHIYFLRGQWSRSHVSLPRVVQGDTHIQSAATNTIVVVTDASRYSPAAGSPHTWEALTFILFAVEVWHDSGQKTLAYSPGHNHISTPPSAKWTRQLGDSNTYLYTEQGHFT